MQKGILNFNIKGSITVESAIAVPFFICAIITVAFLLKVIFVHEMIQHAITETADEIASCSYIYSASGLQSIHDTASDGLSQGEEKVTDQMKILLDSYQHFKSFPDEIQTKINNGADNIKLGDAQAAGDNFNDISQSVDELKAKLGDSGQVIRDIASDPKQELKYITYLLAKTGMENAKTELVLKPLTKAFIVKYLKADENEEIDSRLKALNIEDGFEGLDFSGSSIFKDKKNIEIVVKYNIKPNIPFNIIPEIPVVQRVVTRAWLDGDNDESGFDIWSLPDFERGKRIQQMYGRNLPDNFKTITKFENGVATLVTSINLNAATYQKKPKTVQYLINDAVKDLKSFERDRVTRDENGRTIEYYVQSKDIKYRKLIVVIPKGSSNKEFEKIFSQCKRYADSKKIEISIEEL